MLLAYRLRLVKRALYRERRPSPSDPDHFLFHVEVICLKS